MAIEVVSDAESIDAIASIIGEWDEFQDVEGEEPEDDEEVVDTEEDDDSVDDDEDEEDESTDEESDEEDEDEDEEGEGDDDEEEDDDNEDSESPEPDIDDKEFTVIVDGEEVIVKGEELKNGYMRQSSYTKKTQELASQREKLVEELDQVHERASVVGYQAFERLKKFDNAVKEAGGWDNLRMEVDPTQFEQFVEMYRVAQTEAKNAQSVIDESKEKINAYQLEKAKEAVDSLSSKFSNFDINKLDRYIIDNGFTNDMVQTITHPQAWEMMYKAMKYDEAQSRIAKKKGGDISTTETPRKAKKSRSAPTKPINTTNKSRKLTKALDKQKKVSGDIRKSEAATEEALALILSGH